MEFSLVLWACIQRWNVDEQQEILTVMCASVICCYLTILLFHLSPTRIFCDPGNIFSDSTEAVHRGLS
jgi:hypothetical protein